jgi:FKBP-type peptidyl-prolyl cis-trans isomerase
VPFTLRNLKEDLEDVGSNFDGAPDLEFRLATKALALERSGLSYQSVPPTNRLVAGVGAAAQVNWRGQQLQGQRFDPGSPRGGSLFLPGMSTR